MCCIRLHRLADIFIGRCRLDLITVLFFPTAKIAGLSCPREIAIARMGLINFEHCVLHGGTKNILSHCHGIISTLWLHKLQSSKSIYSVLIVIKIFPIFPLGSPFGAKWNRHSFKRETDRVPGRYTEMATAYTWNVLSKRSKHRCPGTVDGVCF